MPDLLRRLTDLRFLVGTLFITFQIWILLYPQQPLFERPIHLVFALGLLFLWRPLSSLRLPHLLRKAIDFLIIAAVISLPVYYLHQGDRLATRMENVSEVELIDLIMAPVIIFLLLEGVRRAVGWMLLGVIIAFLAYIYFGKFLPGWLHFRGFD